MLNRHKLPFSIVTALILTLLMSITVASAQEAAVGGSANFRDADALNDSLVIKLTGVPAVAGTYEGWLVAANGDKISVGVLKRIVDGTITATYVSPTGVDLLDAYVAFALSQEPVPDPDPQTAGTIIYSDRIPVEVESIMRRLVVGEGSLAGDLRAQAENALTHALLAQNSTTLADEKSHAQHVVNIIEGLGGPGDDVGVLAYAESAAIRGAVAQGAVGDDASVAAIAGEIVSAADNTARNAGRARDAALRFLALTTTNADVLRLEIENVVALSRMALDGTDEDGDGIKGNSGAEGGANTVYTKSQDLGQFEPQAGSDAATPVTGDLLVPSLALAALIAGLIFTVGGGMMVLRRRRLTA